MPAFTSIMAAAGLAAGVGGSVMAADATSSAADQASQTARDVAAQNNATALQIRGENNALLAPFVDAGKPASAQLNALLGLSGAPAQTGAFDTFRDSTGYQFGMNEGMRSLNSMYAGRGALGSGAGAKAAMRYGQDYGRQQGFMPYANLLANQQGMGMSAASAVAGVGQNYANSVMANNNSAGTAAANAALASGTAQAGMYGGIANSLGNFAGNFGSSFGGGNTLKLPTDYQVPNWGIDF